jgi:hypothetical protein
MGSQMGYTGRIGNVIHYKMGNKFYSRSAPRKYKQTKGTKEKSVEFGMASTIGRVIRENLEAVIPEPADRKMQTRLVGEIFNWLQLARHQPAPVSTQSTLDGFRFSSESHGLSWRWKLKFEVNNPVSGQIHIAIPSFIPESALRTPAGASGVVCRIASVVIDIENKEKIGSAQNEIGYTLDRNEAPAQNIIQELPMPGGSLLVTGMCLEYLVVRQGRLVPTNDKLFRPSEIIYAVHN